MSIKWTDGNYNVANLAIDTAITHGVKTEIGTEADYKRLRKLSELAGLFRVEATIDGAVMRGACNANLFPEGIDFGCVTNYNGSANAVSGTIETGSGKMYVTINITALN